MRLKLSVRLTMWYGQISPRDEIPSQILTRDFQFAHSRVQGAAIHPQPGSGTARARNYAMSLTQDAKDMLALDGFERRRRQGFCFFGALSSDSGTCRIEPRVRMTARS